MADKTDKTLNDQLDRIEAKLDILMQRTSSPVEELGGTELTMVREGDHKYMPTEHELRRRTAART